jgi:hypothetical protein
MYVDGETGFIQPEYSKHCRNIDLLLLAHALLADLSCEPDSTNRWPLYKGVDDTQPASQQSRLLKRQQLMGHQRSSFAGNCYTSDLAIQI